LIFNLQEISSRKKDSSILLGIVVEK